MKLIRPIAVTETELVSTNVAESETLWTGGASFALGDIVRGPAGDYEHTLFESLVGSNTGNAVTDETKWLLVGPTNTYRMWDPSPQSQTTNPDSIEVTVQVPGRIDTVYLENVSAEMAHVVMTDAVEGVVFDETYSLVSDSGVTDWWAYFFEPIIRINALTVDNLPPYADAEVSIVLAEAGEDVACGICQLGLSRDLGNTQWGGTVGILDYSRKEADDFGNYTVVQRSYAKRATFSFWVQAGQVDALQVLLASYRATPILLIGSVNYTSTAIYGFIRSFDIEIAYPDVSLCTMEFEGLA